jgi:RNA-directed DNA polymerase
MMESEVMGNYHASFGERDGETRTVRIVKVRTVPTPPSPCLAHLSLHDVWALWAAQGRRRHARGDGISGRYWDDGRGGCPHKDDAEPCRSDLRERGHRCPLALPPEKTRLIEGGRWASERRQRRGQGQPEPCDFLGLTHRCSPTKRGKGTVRRCPSAKRLRKNLQEVQQTRRERRHGPSEKRGAWLTSGVRGHYRD